MDRTSDIDGPPQLRWRLTDDADGQQTLAEGLADPVPGRDELAGLEFFHVRARRIINAVPEAAGLPFRYTVNAYRGCSHACVYCFARPTHEYLNLDSGRDFDRRIVVKVNAAERLDAELGAPRWTGEAIAMGTNTDPYQRCEGRYRLTQRIVETLARWRNPFSILTKSTLVLRDIDLLTEASRRTNVQVALSIGSLDPEVWRHTEPGTPNPLRRMEAVARLNEAGVRCGVLIAPVLPGISDGRAQLRAVVRAAVEAGAVEIGAIPLHLRPGVREHYFDWLRATRPDLAAGYLVRYRAGSYLPVSEQRALGAEIRQMVDRERARVPRSPHPRPAPSRIRQTARRARGGSTEEQLTLAGVAESRGPNPGRRARHRSAAPPSARPAPPPEAPDPGRAVAA